MHILQIEIDNFKSFSGKTVIPFEEGFTTISGPNGSGKSNIIDAILFCLGLSTSRTMRAEKLTDLINNRSRRREALVTVAFGDFGVEAAPKGDLPDDADLGDDEQAAQDAVKMVQSGPQPNTRKAKLVISRRIKDNGQSGYTSTYYLNGRTATLTQVHDRLAQSNISPGCYNVLMQGDVTGIINMSPMERRKIIDEVAGVAEFDRKIEAAQKEIVTTTASIERFELLMGELNQRLEQLTEERKHALKYQQLFDEKKTLEDQQLAAQYLAAKNAIAAVDANLVETRKQKANTQQQLADLLKALEGTRQKLADISAEVKKKGEDQQIALKKQVESLKGAAARKTDTIAFNKEKCIEHGQSIERSKEEQTRLKLKIEDLTVELEGFGHHQGELNQSIKAEQDKLAELETALEKLNQSTGDLTQNHQQLREERTALEDELGKLKRELAEVEAEQFRVVQEKAFLQEQFDELDEKRQAYTTSHGQLQQQLKDAELERAAYEHQIETQTQAVANSRARLKEVQQTLHTMERKLAQLEAQKRAMEEAHFGRAIDTILNAKMDGVHGPLLQLASSQDEYQTALEIAMGSRLRNIVVDDDGVAQDCIALLKNTQAGRATFLPLNKIQGRMPKSSPPKGDGIIDYAYNLLQFDPDYRDVFAYALGETLIVQDMATARTHLTKYRMVTLDGELFERSGAITGGLLGKLKGKSQLGNASQDTERSQLQQAVSKASEELERSEKAAMEAEVKLDELRQQFNRFGNQVQQVTTELKYLGDEASQNAKHAELSDKLKALNTTITELDQTQKRLQKSVTEKTDTLAQLNTNIVQLESKLPTEESNQLRTQMNNIEFQIRSLESKFQQVANDIQSRRLEQEFHEKAIERYSEQIKKCTEDTKTLQGAEAGLLEEIEVINQQITQIEAQAGELDEELKQLQDERDQIQAQLLNEERQKSDIQRNLTLHDEQMTALADRRNHLQGEVRNLAEALREHDVDANELNPDEILDAEEIEKKLVKIVRQMEAMGPVNMRAIEDYDILQERHTELSEKIGTLQTEKSDLMAKIDSYGTQKRDHFNKAFEAIDEHFRGIFAELSDGEGQLLLTNPLDPLSGGLTIQAKPRGKKTLRLESMSGGEKSLTALAFVFAFQRYLPAPFYAFDEVDMFLDGVNAEKLAAMVRKQADNTQFIVVSLRKPMIESSERTIGVTQKQDGITKVTGVLLKHAS
ncbi:MAG: chromosome segregation protein SMC [Vampirovibrionales bacterium]